MKYGPVGLTELPQFKGVWIQDDSKPEVNDVHIYTQNAIVLGHNTKDLNTLNATPLAIVLDEKEITIQYKHCDKDVKVETVCPKVFYKHFKAFLEAVRDETLAKPAEVNE